jgi:hypothetical protein
VTPLTNDGFGIHLIVARADIRAASVSALEAAGIACQAVDPQRVTHLEPLVVGGLEGWRACFQDHRERSFSGIVLVSPPPRLPWLNPGLFDWDAGRPRMVGGLLAPGLANLYVVGPEASGFQAGGTKLLVAMIRMQAGLDYPLVDELIRSVAPSHEPPSGRAIHRLERRLQRRLRPSGSGSWWEGARELDGPLTAARGA